MNRPPPTVSKLLTAALCAGALMISGCEKFSSVPAPSVEPAAQPVAIAPTPPVYTPPTADNLYEMVAPIALYPDKLVAQVLAGSTYPEQVTAADQWLARNATLKAGPLADAAQQQPWDPSIKSLTAFRGVLDQMATSLPWTTALGQAYYNDPGDVMNAIQVMRQRASRAGQLKSSPKLRIATAAAPANYMPDPNAPVVYGGPPIIEPPPQFITIEPAQPDVVYVPSYDPQQIYGESVAAYPGYAYSAPVYAGPAYVQPNYGGAQIAAAGALTFGLGVVVGEALERHDWGWHAWGMNWGRSDTYRGGNPASGGPREFDRPAVVYNNSTYISRSETVVNNNLRNTFVNEARPQQVQALQAQERQQQAQLEQMQRQQAQAHQQQQAQQQQAQQEQARRQQQAQQAQQAQQIQAQQAQAHQQQQAQQQQAQQEQARRQQQAQQAQQAQQIQAQQAQAHQQQQAQQQQAQQEQARRQQQAQQAQQAQQVQAQQAQAHQQQQAQQEQAQQEQARRQQQAQQAQQAHQQQMQQEQARSQQQAQAQLQAQAQAQRGRAVEGQAHAADPRAPGQRKPDEQNH